MARIDELVEQVADPVLRQNLRAALGDLKKRQRFGLVFEEHIPETTALFGLPVQPGALVQRRDDLAAKALYRVAALRPRRQAVIEPIGGGPQEAVPLRALLVVKRFGEPMYPALISLGALRRGGASRPYHAVINGENFHTLQLLRYLYEGQVDCIYIDPPYNSGARDWKYNNCYVDAADAWRHSKWLSFMEKRLRIARRLLKPDGVLIITVDENEVFHLGMLLERLYPDHLRHLITIVINPKGTGKLNFARVDEYAIFCVPDTGKSIITGIPTAGTGSGSANGSSLFADLTEEDAAGDQEHDGPEAEEPEEEDGRQVEEDEDRIDTLPFPAAERDEWELRHARRRGGESSYRHQRKNQFYPIYVDPEHRQVVRAGESLPLEQAPNFSPVNGLKPIWPIDKEGNHRCWRFIPPKMQALIDAGRVVLGRYNPELDTWTLNIWERRPEAKKLKTVWWETAHDAGTHGTTLLHKLLARRDAFPFPKSVYAVRDALAAVVRNRPRALVVDFFAGSGTTLHATCLLNAQDGGARRCVLVTNNEVSATTARKLHSQGIFKGDPEYEKHGIFEQATRPRCKAVVTGKRPDGRRIAGTHIDGRPFSQGLPENLEFFRLSYLDPDEVDLGRQFDAILPALWLAAGGVGARERGADRKDYSLPPGSTYAVLFREAKFRRFQEALARSPAVTHVWLVTDSEEAYAEMRAALPAGMAVSMLYRDYLRNFRINTERDL
jgi:adenine-specific DNA-methyltransferase